MEARTPRIPMVEADGRIEEFEMNGDDLIPLVDATDEVLEDIGMSYSHCVTI